MCQTMLDIWNLKILIYFILNIIIHLLNLNEYMNILSIEHTYWHFFNT